MDFDTLYQSMAQSYEDSTGYPVNPDSDLGIRMQVLAGELLGCYGELEQAQLQMFPQTATGSWLDLHGQARGLTRTQESKAAGSVSFYRATAATSDIVIPQGTVVGTSNGSGACWVTTQDGVLLQGERSVLVEVECTVAGNQGNAAMSQVDTLISALPGISYVSNPEAITGGSRAEDDESFRTRVQEKIAGPAENGNKQHYKTWCESIDGVGRARIFPLWNGPNTVKGTLIDPEGQPCSPSKVTEVQNYIDPATKGYTANVGGKVYTVGDGLERAWRTLERILQRSAQIPLRSM